MNSYVENTNTCHKILEYQNYTDMRCGQKQIIKQIINKIKIYLLVITAYLEKFQLKAKKVYFPAQIPFVFFWRQIQKVCLLSIGFDICTSMVVYKNDE